MTPLNQVAPSRELQARATPGDATKDMVVSVIAEVTRYPREILTPEADLEEELGIDSVKRAEILAVLGSRFDIPESAGPPPGELRTVGDVIAAVQQFVDANAGPAAPAEEPPAPRDLTPQPAVQPAVHAAPAAARGGADESFSRKVIDVIAQVTRYPRELLTPDADLEEDLGFDQDQRSSIFGALRQQVVPGLPAIGLTPTPRTLGDIIAAAERYAAERTAARAEPAPAVSAPAVVSSSRPVVHASKPFAGRTALVTGSGHGLGRALALHLSKLGATVVVNSFHSRQRGEECAQEIVDSGGEAVHLWGSVANPAHLDSIFGEIGKRYGGLDFFISNASNGLLAPLTNVTAEDWDKAFRTNVVALHQGALLASRLMQKRGGGKIVAMSTSASQRHVEHFGCMGPVKAAVECLVRYLAIELGALNIQVNALSAGPVYGELLDKLPDGDKLRPRWEANVPRGRFNDEHEVADAVTFLLTNSGMNGTTLLLDAGGTQRIVAST